MCVCVCLSGSISIYVAVNLTLCVCEGGCLRECWCRCAWLFFICHIDRETQTNTYREKPKDKRRHRHIQRHSVAHLQKHSHSLNNHAQSLTLTHSISDSQPFSKKTNFFSPIICDMLMKNPNFSVTFRVDTL